MRQRLRRGRHPLADMLYGLPSSWHRRIDLRLPYRQQRRRQRLLRNRRLGEL